MKGNHKGIIFIVDISGYSRFVAKTDNGEGSLIISGLLEAIIAANELPFHISEIEGDAVLFYRHGPAYTVQVILSQFERMLRFFQNKLVTFRDQFPITASLSIKLIVHYGVIGRLVVGHHIKLFGESVVEAHKLLKNSIDTHTYALFTDAYFDEQVDSTAAIEQFGIDASDQYDIGQLRYTYFRHPFNPKLLLPITPIRSVEEPSGQLKLHQATPSKRITPTKNENKRI